MNCITNIIKFTDNTTLPSRWAGSRALSIYTGERIDMYMQVALMLQTAIAEYQATFTTIEIIFVAQLPVTP